MRVEKLPSGSYRIRKTINGKTYTKTFDHRPLKFEMEHAFESIDEDSKNITFREALNSMIEMKKNVISPASVRKYISMSKNFSERFASKGINDITQADVQKEINDLALERSAKTVRDYNSLITSVFAIFRPSLGLHTKLPMREPKKDIYIPTTDDIKKILAEVRGTEFEVPVLLGCYSMRRSEICALEESDVEGNTIHISKAMVLDENTDWVIKSTKTTASTRDIYVPDEVIDAINRNGLYTGHPNSLNKHLNRVQDKLSLPHFSFHKLRHYFASECHAKGIPDADIMKYGGWETDHVMKEVYRHATYESSSVAQAISLV